MAGIIQFFEDGNNSSASVDNYITLKEKKRQISSPMQDGYIELKMYRSVDIQHLQVDEHWKKVYIKSKCTYTTDDEVHSTVMKLAEKICCKITKLR